MSMPSDVFLTWVNDGEPELGNEPSIEVINNWLRGQMDGKDWGEFHDLPDAFFNGYTLANVIYFGTFNFFSPDELLGFLRTFEWDVPESVQLVVRDSEEVTFEIFTLEDFRPDKPKLTLVQSAPSAGQNQFEGQLVAFNGTLTLLSLEKWGDIIERGGGHITLSVSERATLVVGGQNRDMEWAKAHRLGILLIEERDLYSRLSDANKA